MVVIVLLLILASACTDTTTIESAITAQYPEDMEDPLYPITMTEGITLMNSIFSKDDTILNTTISLSSITARNVDREGKAEQWIFGTVANGDYYFVVVKSNRGVLVPYQGVPGRDIDLQAILLPDALITGNEQLIREAFGNSDIFPFVQIDLINDMYIITPSATAGKRILYFNAFTGQPMNAQAIL